MVTTNDDSSRLLNKNCIQESNDAYNTHYDQVIETQCPEMEKIIISGARQQSKGFLKHII